MSQYVATLRMRSQQRNDSLKESRFVILLLFMYFVSSYGCSTIKLVFQCSRFVISFLVTFYVFMSSYLCLLHN